MFFSRCEKSSTMEDIDLETRKVNVFGEIFEKREEKVEYFLLSTGLAFCSLRMMGIL